MKTATLFLIFIPFCALSLCCSRKGDTALNPSGEWTCMFRNDEFSGSENVSLAEDKTLKITDSLIYNYSEKDVEINLPCQVENEGTWILSNNNIRVSLGPLKITPDTVALKIRSKSDKLFIDTLASDYSDLKRDLYQTVSLRLNELFKDRSERSIELGKIVMLTPDTLIIVRNGVYITLSHAS